MQASQALMKLIFSIFFSSFLTITLYHLFLSKQFKTYGKAVRFTACKGDASLPLDPHRVTLFSRIKATFSKALKLKNSNQKNKKTLFKNQTFVRFFTVFFSNLLTSFERFLVFQLLFLDCLQVQVFVLQLSFLIHQRTY